jgi:hypothetical protein
MAAEVDFTDEEEEFGIRLFKFETDLRLYLQSEQTDQQTIGAWFVERWRKFTKSIPILNQKNYPSILRQVLALLKHSPDTVPGIVPFFHELVDFRLETLHILGEKILYKSDLRQRQFLSCLEKLHEHSAASFNEAQYESTMAAKTCVCGKTKKDDGSKLNLCSNCKVQSYCGPACQKADWKRHKPECRAICAENEANSTGLLAKKASKGGKRRKKRTRKLR